MPQGAVLELRGNPEGAALARVRALEVRTADLDRRPPAHSAPSSSPTELEDLEDRLAAARAQTRTAPGG